MERRKDDYIFIAESFQTERGIFTLDELIEMEDPPNVVKVIWKGRKIRSWAKSWTRWMPEQGCWRLARVASGAGGPNTIWHDGGI